MAAANNNNMNLEILEENLITLEETINFVSDVNGTLMLNIPVVQNTNESSQLDELLKTFDLSEVKPYLTRAEITFESLKYLSKENIKEAIPFVLVSEKNYLFGEKYGIDDDILSETIANKVVSWLQNQSNTSTTNTPTSSICTSDGSSKLSKSLKLILEDSLKGKSIKSFYEKNCQLTDSFRGDLINIIQEDIFYRDVKLSPKDLTAIVDEIIANFSCEIREYYFIPRGKKANPAGKLWDKYVNQRAKRVRSSVKIGNSLQDSDSISHKDYRI